MKNLKKFSIILVVAIMVITCATYTYAIGPDSVSGKITNDTSFDSIGQKIIGILQAVGSVVAIAILVVLGIKYMLGSAEEKAEYKKTMLPYVIGAVLIFAAANIASMVYTFATGI